MLLEGGWDVAYLNEKNQGNEYPDPEGESVRGEKNRKQLAEGWRLPAQNRGPNLLLRCPLHGLGLTVANGNGIVWSRILGANGWSVYFHTQMKKRNDVVSQECAKRKKRNTI